MPLKIELRHYFKTVRNLISPQRRFEAAKALLEFLPDLGTVLSFWPFGTEIDLQPINQKLLKENKLLLPRVEKNEIVPYLIHDLKNGFSISSLKILEPDPEIHRREDYFDAVLVPGLGFDRNKHRLGYGKGHYDRLLAKYQNVKKIGVGFFEQFFDADLPSDPWDIPLDEIVLV